MCFTITLRFMIWFLTNEQSADARLWVWKSRFSCYVVLSLDYLDMIILGMIVTLGVNVVVFSHHYCTLLILRILCDFSSSPFWYTKWQRDFILSAYSCFLNEWWNITALIRLSVVSPKRKIYWRDKMLYSFAFYAVITNLLLGLWFAYSNLVYQKSLPKKLVKHSVVWIMICLFKFGASKKTCQT